MQIGVLALQGAFAEHIRVLQQFGARCREIRQLSDFGEDMDGIVLPGGESTVMSRLLQDLELLQPIRQAVQFGLPAFGTCAGMILLAKEIDESDFPRIPVMDIRVRRNAYGRQLGSFTAIADFAGIGAVPMTFIRAPCVDAVWNDVDVLAVVDDRIVAARQRNILATAFHPELTNDTSIHEYFLEMVSSVCRLKKRA